MPDNSPFSQTYTRIWAILEAHAGFAALVKPGNRIKFTGDDIKPPKDRVNVGDLPQVALVQGPFNFPGYATGTSVAVQFEQTYQVQLAVRDLRIDDTNAVKWAVCSAMHMAGPHLGLTDPQAGQFVRNWRIQNSSDAFAELSDALRWQSVLDILVTMEWPRAALT